MEKAKRTWTFLKHLTLASIFSRSFPSIAFNSSVVNPEKFGGGIGGGMPNGGGENGNGIPIGGMKPAKLGVDVGDWVEFA